MAFGFFMPVLHYYIYNKEYKDDSDKYRQAAPLYHITLLITLSRCEYPPASSCQIP